VHEIKHDGYRLIMSERKARLARAPPVSAILRTMRFADRTEHSPGLSVSRSLSAAWRTKMNAFLRRFLMHYGIYRRYPLGRLPALRNAWRTARP
jgi:hypothetical protein